MKGCPAFAAILFLALCGWSRPVAAQVDVPEEMDHAVALERALEALDAAHRKHRQVLLDVLGKVPVSARPGILRAIEAAEQGRQNARNQLEKLRGQKIGKGNAKGGGKPEGVGKRKSKGKPEGVGPPADKGKKGRPLGVGPGKGKPGGAGPGKGKGKGKP